MKIIYKNLELYDSTAFICLGLGETKVILGEGDELLTFILDFRIDIEKTEEGLVEFEEINSSTLRAILTNWNNPIGATLTHPLTGGELFGRELTIIFSVKKVGAKGEFRNVELSVYLSLEVADGKN